ncbi:hypothetical protein [Vallitalea okinawensis]|uniref:hypothetical protein n=1 Tax=Vallitalea okinawensis TaxID=2078660 RepID=UPI000CFCFF9D|nr:hypothetical protein [Vallitalea okinawensis]
MKSLGLDFKTIATINEFELYKDEVKRNLLTIKFIKNKLRDGQLANHLYQNYIPDLQNILQYTLWLISHYQQSYFGCDKVIYQIQLFEIAVTVDFVINMLNYVSQLQEEINKQFFIQNTNNAIDEIEKHIVRIEEALNYKEGINSQLPDLRSYLIKPAPIKTKRLNGTHIKNYLSLMKKDIYKFLQNDEGKANLLYYQLDSVYTQIINAYNKDQYQVDLYPMLIFDYEQLHLYALFDAYEEDYLDEESRYYVQKSKKIILDKIVNHIQLYRDMLK